MSLQLDLVVPTYDEAEELPGFFASLAAQTDPKGEPLPDGTIRVVVVDGGSRDATPRMLDDCRRAYPGIEIVVLAERTGSHVEARRLGAGLLTTADGIERARALVNADADTRFHPLWLADVAARIDSGAVDALTYAGHFPAEFWKRVPRLATAYANEIGTIFFGPATIAHYRLAPSGGLFKECVFHDLVRVPSDCAWALSKEAYLAAGGFRREFDEDGRELLFGGRNLRFRLDALGARVAYVSGSVAHGTEKTLLLEHKAAIDRHLASCGIPVSYTNVFWGGRSEIKPSEISPQIYRQWLAEVGVGSPEPAQRGKEGLH